MKKILSFLKSETVLSASLILALISIFFVKPSKDYLSYIDWRSLAILWSLMVVMAGLRENGFFDSVGKKLLSKTGKLWQIVLILVALCFFSSMLITNDVSLITFVPFAIYMLDAAGAEKLIMPVVVMQTCAANLGSMLTPLGNPQNLYIYSLSGMSFGGFLLVMLPYTVVSALLIGIYMVYELKKNKITAGNFGDVVADKIEIKKECFLYCSFFSISSYGIKNSALLCLICCCICSNAFVFKKNNA